MTTAFREEWRRWHAEQLKELAWQVRRMVIRMSHFTAMYRLDCGRIAEEAEFEQHRLYFYDRFDEELWPEHRFGLSNYDCISLADSSEGFVGDGLLQACRKIAEDWLWNTMQAKVCTDKIELPTDFF